MKLLSEAEVRAIYHQGEEAMVGLFMQLQEQVQRVTERVTTLEAQVNRNSHNSHQPPSGDGYRKPPPQPKSLRRKTGRRRGGQAGHPGSTLEMVMTPDRIEMHWPQRCAGCGQMLATEAVVSATGATGAFSGWGYEARQVHDLPEIRMEVTEHRAMQVQCACCGARTQGAFPAGVSASVQYGSGVAALGVYAQVYQLLPLERTRQLLGDIVKCWPSEGTLVNLLATCAERVAPINAQIKAALLCADVLHVDETGVRAAGQLFWLHSASTESLTYYAVDAKRGKQAHARIGLLPAYTGVAIHDALISYLRLPGYAGTHGLCNAHLLRELTALEEQLRQRWPAQLKTVLLEMKHSVEQARERGRGCLEPALQKHLEAAYDRLVQSALRANPRPAYRPNQRGRPPASPARNLAERLRDHKDSVLHFLRDFRVPFDNNLAERDLRMMKVKQKVSGCFRSEQGAHVFAAVRGYLSTVRKQGHDVLAALRALFDGQPMPLQLA